MKDIFNFLRWQWRKWESWQKMYMLSAFTIGVGLASEQPYKFYIILTGFGIMFGYAVKWFMWDRIIESYQEYKKEKSQLFETIKTSDQK